MKLKLVFILILFILYINVKSIENSKSLYVVIGGRQHMQCYNFLLIKDIYSNDTMCLLSDELEINDNNDLRKIKLNDTFKLDIYPCKDIKKIRDSCYCCIEKLDSLHREMIIYVTFFDSSFKVSYCSDVMYNLSLPDSCFIKK